MLTLTMIMESNALPTLTPYQTPIIEMANKKAFANNKQEAIMS